MNGMAPAAFGVTVDGTNASLDPELPSAGFYQAFNVINIVNTEGIQEVSTTKSIAPASVAGSMSGNINIITKGGTNDFHGSLFEFNSVSRFNARNQFLITKPRSTFNQYGGSIGGPILRNHLFFFGGRFAPRRLLWAFMEFPRHTKCSREPWNPWVPCCFSGGAPHWLEVCC